MKHLVLQDNEIYHDKIILQEENFHYLIHVKKEKVGNTFSALFKGMRYECKIISISHKTVEGCILTSNKIQQEFKSNFHIIISLLKSNEHENVIKQAVEVGVSKITLFQAKNSISHLDQKIFEKKKVRIDKIMINAMQQSGNPNKPQLHYINNIDDIDDIDKNNHLALIAHQEKTDLDYQKSQYQQYNNITLAIGPEGGFSEKEITVFQKKGFKSILFPTYILRAKNASLYALAYVKGIQEGFK